MVDRTNQRTPQHACRRRPPPQITGSTRCTHLAEIRSNAQKERAKEVGILARDKRKWHARRPNNFRARVLRHPALRAEQEHLMPVTL